MRTRMLFTLALIAGLVTGCGSEAPSATVDVTKGGRAEASVAVDIGKLVPADAVAVLYAPSLDDLVQKIKGVVASVEPKMAQSINLDEMREKMPLGKYLDGTRPICICASMAGRGEPTPMLIFPVTDVEKAKGVQGGPPRVFSGDYVSMLMGPGTPPEAATTTHRLLQEPVTNDITVRIDVAALTQKFSRQIDEGLGQMTRETRGTEAADMMRDVAKFMRDMVDSADVADLGLTISGSTVDAYVGLSVKEGSTLDKMMPAGSGEAAAIAKLLPSGFPISGTMHLDGEVLTKFGDWFANVMEKMAPGNEGAELGAYMRKSMEMYKDVGPNYAFAGGFGKGIQMVMVGDVKTDVDTVFAKVDALYQDDVMKKMGMLVEKKPGQKVNGVDVTSYSMKMDMAKMAGGDVPPQAQQQMEQMMNAMFGGDAIQFHMAAVGGKYVYAMGDIDLMTRAIQAATAGGSDVAPGLSKAITRAGGTPTFAMELDLRGLLNQVLPVIQEMAPSERIPQLGDGAPARIVLFGGRDGRTFRGGLSMDVGELAKVVKALMPR